MVVCSSWVVDDWRRKRASGRVFFGAWVPDSKLSRPTASRPALFPVRPWTHSKTRRIVSAMHAGIEVLLVHAQHVKQLKGRKTDIADSLWLARICQFALCAPSLVPPAQFRALRKVSRMRRQLVRERARTRNRIHQVLDAAGMRVGGILSDLFGANGTRILEGLVAGDEREDILASLSHHVAEHAQAFSGDQGLIGSD